MKKLGTGFLLLFSVTFIGCNGVEFSKNHSTGTSSDTPLDDGNGDEVGLIKLENITGIQISRTTHFGIANIAETTGFEILVGNGPDPAWSLGRSSRRSDVGLEECANWGGPLDAAVLDFAINSLAGIEISPSTGPSRPPSTEAAVRFKVTIAYGDGHTVTFITSTSSMIEMGEPVGSSTEALVDIFDRYDSSYPYCGWLVGAN